MATVDVMRGAGVGMGARKSSGWFLAIAAVFVILGVMAIVEPVVAGLAVTLLVGWLLMLGGLTHIMAAFGGGGTSRVVTQLALGAIYTIGGAYFLTHPVLALGTLTLFLAGILLAQAIVEIVAYFRMQGESGAGWLLVNGITTLLLGGLIWFRWPSSSVWAIGTLVGINLLMTGTSRLMLGMALRRLTA